MRAKRAATPRLEQVRGEVDVAFARPQVQRQIHRHAVVEAEPPRSFGEPLHRPPLRRRAFHQAQLVGKRLLVVDACRALERVEHHRVHRHPEPRVGVKRQVVVVAEAIAVGARRTPLVVEVRGGLAPGDVHVDQHIDVGTKLERFGAGPLDPLHGLLVGRDGELGGPEVNAEPPCVGDRSQLGFDQGLDLLLYRFGTGGIDLGAGALLFVVQRDPRAPRKPELRA